MPGIVNLATYHWLVRSGNLENLLCPVSRTVNYILRVSPYTHRLVKLSLLTKEFLFAEDRDHFRMPQLVTMQRTADCGMPNPTKTLITQPYTLGIGTQWETGRKIYRPEEEEVCYEVVLKQKSPITAPQKHSVYGSGGEVEGVPGRSRVCV